MSILRRVEQQFEASAEVKQVSKAVLAPKIAAAAQLLTDALMQDKKILICGNGGSAADAQHLAAELVNRFEMERPGLPAIALTTDSSILTSISNDYDFQQIFSKQVFALGLPGDVLIAITTSGSSPNVLRAVEAAHTQSMPVIALTGRGGGAMNALLTAQDIHLCVPSERTARVQEVHLLTIHCLCDLIDHILLGDE